MISAKEKFQKTITIKKYILLFRKKDKPRKKFKLKFIDLPLKEWKMKTK